MKNLAIIAAITAAHLLSLSSAHAQGSPATCSFDGPSATLTVNVDGSAALSVASRAIRLDGTQCGAATVDNTNTILVNGGGNADVVTVSGTYAPGLTTETEGSSEIELTFSLGAGRDTVKVNGTRNPDLLTFAQGGLDIGNDGDQDMTMNTVEVIHVFGKDGNDTLDASAYGWGGVILHGGNGDDTLVGSAGNDSLYGDAGIDALHGGPGNDKMWGGINDDLYFGEAGMDTMWAEATSDGDDEFYGGADVDWLTYEKRTTSGVTVTIGNGAADDGGPGENDYVDLDVENVKGGASDDNLTGSPSANFLFAGAGDDVLNGGGGDDYMIGEDGNDILIGGAGNDYLRGDSGVDDLRGGGGDDDLLGGDGNDTLDGQAGNDYLSGDANDDTITGGTGVDEYFGGTGDDTINNWDGEYGDTSLGYSTTSKQQPWTHSVPSGHRAPSGSSTHSVTPGSHSVPVPAQKIAQASPESPPLFWSPSWAMTWMRYEWPEMRPTSNRSSEPYFSPHARAVSGTGSADEVRSQWLAAGSASGVPVWSAASTAPFHVPKTATGS